MKEVEYSNNPYRNKNIFQIYGDLISDLWTNRELIKQLIQRDFSARYKQSLIGILWVFIMPFVTMGTFLLLHLSGIVNIGTIDVPYPIYGLLSISLWNIFSTGLSNATWSLEQSKNVISRVNISKTALVLASFGQISMDFLVRLLILLVVFLLYKKVPSVYSVALPLMMIPIFFMTYGMVFITAMLQVLIKDTTQFVNLFINFSLLLMPIMYSVPKIGILSAINRFNPLLYIITAPRDLIIYGSISYPVEYLISSFFAILFFLVSWIFFYQAVPRIIEKI